MDEVEDNSRPAYRTVLVEDGSELCKCLKQFLLGFATGELTGWGGPVVDQLVTFHRARREAAQGASFLDSLGFRSGSPGSLITVSPDCFTVAEISLKNVSD